MATLGKTDVGGTISNWPVGYAFGCRFLCTEDGDATELVAYIQGRYEAGLCKGKIYEDVAGSPGAILAESPEITLENYEAWHHFIVSYPFVAGTFYWFIVHASVECRSWSDVGSTNQTSFSYGLVYPTNPDPWGTPYDPLYSDTEISIHAVYTSVTPPPEHILSVASTPLSGLTFTLRGGAIADMTDVTPWSGSLEEGIYEVEMPSNVVVGEDTYNFLEWQDGTTNPIKQIDLTSDVSLNATYQLQTPPPPGKGYVEVHAFVNAVEVVADGLVVDTSFTFQTPATIEADPGSYTIQLTYGEITRNYAVDVTEGETIRVDGQLAPPGPSISRYIAYGGLAILPVSLLVLIAKKKK